jgi:hypothetical protein
MISRMIGTSLFSDRTEFSVITAHPFPGPLRVSGVGSCPAPHFALQCCATASGEWYVAILAGYALESTLQKIVQG